MCYIGQFLIDTVIIVISFVWGQHRVFVIAIVMCECDILIYHKFKNQEQQNLIWYCNAYFFVGFSGNSNTEYNYVNVLSNIFTPLFLIAQLNLTYSFFSYIPKNHWNNARVLARLFSQQVPILRNRCTFSFGHLTGWELCTHY